jgi:hypothetical protein
MFQSFFDYLHFQWICSKEAAHGTIERANAWFWLVGIPVVWFGGVYLGYGELMIPDHPQGFLTFMVVMVAASWVVFFVFRFLGAPSRLYWKERRINDAARDSAGAAKVIRDQSLVHLTQLEAFWDEAEEIEYEFHSMPGYLGNNTRAAEWAGRVEKYLKEIGQPGEAVMFKTIPDFENKKGKLRKILGRVGGRATG